MALEGAMPGRLVRWLATDEPDWNAVYAEQLPKVYNFFRYRCGPGADIEELTARTFEKAWRARERYRHDIAGFSTWLISIARNVAIDDFRARKPLVPIDAASTIAAAGRTPEESAIHESDAGRLAALLEGLPERDRELLSLKYGAGITNRAIAQATGLSESNVGTILHRAIQTLRQQWSASAPSELRRDRSAAAPSELRRDGSAAAPSEFRRDGSAAAPPLVRRDDPGETT